MYDVLKSNIFKNKMQSKCYIMGSNYSKKKIWLYIYEEYLLLSQIKKKVLLGFFFKGKIKLIFQDLIFDIL